MGAQPPLTMSLANEKTKTAQGGGGGKKKLIL